MNTYKNNAKIFKAFSDENRLKIIEILLTGEKCACILLKKMKITQPTLSHHMKILVDSLIVSPRKDGKWTHYSINKEGSKNALILLKKLTLIQKEKTQTKKY